MSSCFLNNNTKNINSYQFNNFAYMFNFFYLNSFKTKLKITGLYKKTNKVDILIANHLNFIDSMMISSILKIIDDRPFYFIIRKGPMIHMGGLSLLISKFKCIFINKNANTDIEIIRDKISEINDGIIIIFPEGSIFSKNTHEKSLNYCKKNNLKPFNNLLYPRTTGLWIIINELKKKNKLGNLIDFSILLTKCKEKSNVVDNLIYTTKPLNKDSYDIGDTVSIIRTYNLAKYTKNKDMFNKFFIKIWREKDIILEGPNYKKYNYKLIQYNKSKKIEILLLLFIILIVNIHLIKHTHGKILLVYLFIIIYQNIKLIYDHNKYKDIKQETS
jgi:1-acyl-sn-glycerol-3-phosphate acyltransferase